METVQSETCHCLSSQSFQEGCKTLHQLFVDADLPGIRTELRQEGDQFYINILFPLNIESQDLANPGRMVSRSKGQDDENDDCNEDDSCRLFSIEDNDDEAAIHHSQASMNALRVEYQILYSLSYQVPVLYFFLQGPPSFKLYDIDTVYDYLVPAHLSSGARGVGVMGGIGMTNHPITGLPCFWVHPCNSAEAVGVVLGNVEGKNKPLEYLMVWIGIVGAVIGFNLPHALVAKSVDLRSGKYRS